MASCTYNGVSFDVDGQESNTRPEWTVREYSIWRQKIPFSNLEEVQDGGRSNETLEVTAIVYSAADKAALLASQGVTKRTLSIYGRSDTNVWLPTASNVRRHAWQDWWILSLTFEREVA